LVLIIPSPDVPIANQEHFFSVHNVITLRVETKTKRLLPVLGVVPKEKLMTPV